MIEVLLTICNEQRVEVASHLKDGLKSRGNGLPKGRLLLELGGPKGTGSDSYFTIFIAVLLLWQLVLSGLILEIGW